METLHVLIIEDEEPMRVAVHRALARLTLRLPDVEGEFRFAVDEAGSAEEGLEKIAAQTPDIVLLDHKLPGMSGVELLALFSERQPEFLTVMMTAYATLENAVIATKRGAYDFLAKPFTPEELKAVITKTTQHLLLTRETRRLAREKHQVRFQFISVLVHELKAPLAAVQGYLYLMKDGIGSDDPAVQERAVERCLARTDGMRKLILDLLDLTRLESGQKRRELVTVDLREVARTAIESVLPDATARGIQVTLLPGEPVTLEADRSEMEIVLNNLVTNAVKYNRDQGRVDVGVESCGDTATIRVADTGIGMSEEECGRLFQEFVRIKNSKTRNIPGSGLGLSILRKLARLYGGDVQVESAPEAGSTFTVELQRTPSPALRATATPEAAADTPAAATA
jgi:two-component system, sensor histidine kinase and response regulator